MTGHGLKIVLLGLTGLGNSVLKSVVGSPLVSECTVFANSYSGPYPYYPEEQLSQACERLGVRYHADLSFKDPDTIRLLESYQPDLLLLATFKQILPPAVLKVPRLGAINFHPSLLPLYRGACPTQAAILAGDLETGITVCFLTDELDAGDVLLQRIVTIEEDDDDGRLRQKLADAAGRMVPEILQMYAGGNAPTTRAQDHKKVSWAKRPRPEILTLDSAESAEEVQRRFRALTPYPKPIFSQGDISRHVIAMRRDLPQDGGDWVELHGVYFQLGETVS